MVKSTTFMAGFASYILYLNKNVLGLSECLILLCLNSVIDAELVAEKIFEATSSRKILQAFEVFRTITLCRQFNCPTLVPPMKFTAHTKIVDFFSCFFLWPNVYNCK